MKNVKLLIIGLIFIGTICYAGGDIHPVTVFEQEDIKLADTYVEPIKPPFKPEPKEVSTIVPQKVKQEDINPSGFYAALGITMARYNTGCNCPNIGGIDNNIALVARLGYDFNPYIGIEARGIRTIAKDNGGQISHTGLFLKPMYPIIDQANLYALIGVAKTSTSGKLRKVHAEGLAMGAGFEYDLSVDNPKEGKYAREFNGQGDQEKGLGLFVDYERLIVKKNAPDMDTISAGVTYDF